MSVEAKVSEKAHLICSKRQEPEKKKHKKIEKR